MRSYGRRRVVIQRVFPQMEGGEFPAKRVAGEEVVVEADLFSDGHDQLSAALLYKKAGEKEWRSTPMRPLINDRWRGSFQVEQQGEYVYTVQGWIDRYNTSRMDVSKKREAGQDVSVDLMVAAGLLERAAQRADKQDAEKMRAAAREMKEQKNLGKALDLILSDELAEIAGKYPAPELVTTYKKELPVAVERERALFSAWYEMFPRSCTPRKARHGTFKDCEALLPEIARMGFNVLYFPPIHPIGRTARKGRNNSPQAGPEDPGSPWAIGSQEGGHKSVHPELGAMEDFQRLVQEAGRMGMEVALDLAFQCSRDHPYIKEHPEWFSWRPDGSIQFAENPPKKYEDIVPLDFETESWRELWEELKSIVLFWIDKGVRIFRVDNPHTKPFEFWEWLISEVRSEYPEVIFLCEAFTRPKVMKRLAKAGFSQSYTYFTWRNTKREITEYVTELTATEARHYFRPNFWPNTPDILPEFLQYGGRPAFIIRLVLAATLSSNYGIYGPAFELMASEALPDREEYLNAEKYEIKEWDVKKPGNLRDFISRLNRIRKDNPALWTTWNLSFEEADNDFILYYMKSSPDMENTLLIVVSLDPFHPQSGWLRAPTEKLGITPGAPFLVYDLLSEDKYIWQSEWNFIKLDPRVLPVHIFRVHRRLRREEDFDYYL